MLLLLLSNAVEYRHDIQESLWCKDPLNLKSNLLSFWNHQILLAKSFSLDFLRLDTATFLLTCTKTVKRCLSWEGLPREPGYSQSKSSPSNPYWRRNWMTEEMKVLRFSGVATMAVKLREIQRRQSEVLVATTSCWKVKLLYFCLKAFH